MAKVILICGKICSGKTSYAKSLSKDISSVLLSVDEITILLFGPDGGKGHDLAAKKTGKYLYQKTLEIIDSGINVVLDWGFWKNENRKEASNFFKSHSVAFEWHYIDTPEDLLRKNLSKRNRDIEEGNVSFYYFDEDLADEFWGMFEVPAKSEMDVWINNQTG